MSGKLMSGKLTPEQQAQIRELNDFAHWLGSLPTPERSTVTKQAGLKLLQKSATKIRGPRTRIIKVGTILAIAALIIGVVISAATSLPGDKLYSLKRFGENIRYSFTFSEATRADNSARIMKTRAQEFQKLTQRNKKISATTVESIMKNILAAADDYQKHIDQTPAEIKEELSVRRQSDAAIVMSLLVKSNYGSLYEPNLKTVQDTIQALKRIADG